MEWLSDIVVYRFKMYKVIIESSFGRASIVIIRRAWNESLCVPLEIRVPPYRHPFQIRVPPKRVPPNRHPCQLRDQRTKTLEPTVRMHPKEFIYCLYCYFGSTFVKDESLHWSNIRFHPVDSSTTRVHIRSHKKVGVLLTPQSWKFPHCES